MYIYIYIHKYIRTCISLCVCLCVCVCVCRYACVGAYSPVSTYANTQACTPHSRRQRCPDAYICIHMYKPHACIHFRHIYIYIICIHTHTYVYTYTRLPDLYNFVHSCFRFFHFSDSAIHSLTDSFIQSVHRSFARSCKSTYAHTLIYMHTCVHACMHASLDTYWGVLTAEGMAWA